MADADTRDKRFAMLGLASCSRREQQNPTGTVGAVARAMLLFLYGGIALNPPTQPVPRSLSYLARRDTTLAKPAQNNTTQTYLARRDTTGSYSGSES